MRRALWIVGAMVGVACAVASAQTRPLESYVAAPKIAQAPPPEASALVDKLNEAVAEMVAAGHLEPAYNENGIGATVYQFGNPAQTVYALSMALPYLNGELKAKTIGYLKQEMAAYPPLTMAWSDGKGARREYHSLPESLQKPTLNVKPVVPDEAIYAVWAYCDATGDWDYAKAHAGEIEAIFKSAAGRFTRYGQILAAIGYARIMDKLGDKAKAAAGSQTAVQMMEAGRDFKKTLAAAEKAFLQTSIQGTEGDWHIALFYFERTPQGYHTYERAPVGVFLAPELGEYMADQVPDARAFFQDLFQTYRAWPVVRGDMGGTHHSTGERAFFFIDQQFSAFMAQAYILKADPAVLTNAVDYPYCKGDLFYIQKLVEAIRAPARR